MDNGQDGKTLFIVDDEPGFRSYIAMAAGREGWTVVEFPDAREMIGSLKALSTPDLIFVDLHMPGKDGTELLMESEMREQVPNVPIYVITGGMAANATAAKLIGKGLGLNVVETVFKPLKVQKIKEILARH
ncbi:response regulator [Tropicimonas sp. TH_r6]|uniref:response regulator n=1 Tax=Tropicimonas sp. TH_r6 TaxID=3082085 RepID=UPI002955D035|nr:response regulator [Tropicimonas sp. TH_r6]MDV7144246.1 response regulator [Tropicimonas sp. TH_r6]